MRRIERAWVIAGPLLALVLGASCGGDGDGAGAGSGSSIDLGACLACGEGECPDEHAACNAAAGCTDLIGCVLDCDNDLNCLSNCGPGASAATKTTAVQYGACAIAQCADECTEVATPGVGGTGSLGTGGGGPGGTGGTSGPNTGGASPGTGGSSPLTPGSGNHWLTLVNDAAPESESPNDVYGINGVLYGYGDACVTPTLVWDATRRCLSGTLCPWNATNWGAAIGFDFYNTGATGSPPNTKRTWDATRIAARGIQWRVTTGLLSNAQLWILNMDPSWGNQCSAADCGINGPPDGYGTIPYMGTMYFDNLRKDDWGGTGTNYVFNAQRILALQFKLPGPDPAGSATFSFCVDAIGVIL